MLILLGVEYGTKAQQRVLSIARCQLWKEIQSLNLKYWMRKCQIAIYELLLLVWFVFAITLMI